MERAEIIREEIIENENRFLAISLETSNSYMIILSEKEDKLGTLAIAVPPPKDLLGSVSSSILLGEKNAITTRMFAEYLASKKGKISLVSIYLDKCREKDAQTFFKRLIEKVFHKSI